MHLNKMVWKICNAVAILINNLIQLIFAVALNPANVGKDTLKGNRNLKKEVSIHSKFGSQYIFALALASSLLRFHDLLQTYV